MHTATYIIAVLATALKRSQSNIVEIMAKMQGQQELHVQHCRQSAEAKCKLVRVMKLQRRVAQLGADKMQKRLKCAQTGAVERVKRIRLSDSMSDCACSTSLGAGGGRLTRALRHGAAAAGELSASRLCCAADAWQVQALQQQLQDKEQAVVKVRAASLLLKHSNARLSCRQQCKSSGYSWMKQTSATNCL
jgi:hypothetical protein